MLVVGAGPAGLATSRELARRHIDHLVLERGDRIAHTWAHLYDSLTLHTGKHLSALPGMRFPASTPLFPSRLDFLDYLGRYAEAFRLPIETRCGVSSAERVDGRWRVRTVRGDLDARTLVVATGILSNPCVPEFPGRDRFRGRVMHSVEYRRPNDFAGARVLVVGVGNSGGETSAELARAGARVTVAVRSGAIALPLRLLGVPIQYFAYVTSKLPASVQRAVITFTTRISERRRGPAVLPRPAPSSCPDVPLIGFHLIDAIRDGSIDVRSGVSRFTEDGVQFTDGSEGRFDRVLLATGYRAAVGILDGVIRLDDCGFALRTERVASVDHQNLYFVGHNYNTTGGLYNIARDARIVGRMITASS